MIDRIFQFSCDYCEHVIEKPTNKFPSGWKYSQILLERVNHICGTCVAEGLGEDRRWKEGGR